MRAASDIPNVASMPIPTKEDLRESFPSLLHRMLAEIDLLETDERNLREIVSWQEHGMAFQIHNRERFIDVIMPLWFPKLKYSSWVRQVNSYGFKRVQKEGNDRGALYHSNFIRDMPELAAGIEKTKRKSKGNKQNAFPFGRSTSSMHPSLSAPMLNQWQQLPNGHFKDASKSMSAPSSSEGLCGMMINSRMSLAPRGPLPIPSNCSWSPSGQVSSSWFSNGGQESGPATSKLFSAPMPSQPTNDQPTVDDDLEPLDMFDGMWSTVLENDIASSMVPQNERLSVGSLKDSEWDDMEPLRIFGPDDSRKLK
ncbi:stress transcription factor A [Seminavis robusta]|uniref:Stress transcription factor A n=1 Tax=Seminavis robusta TaxID=568900 RepID=A0A9N8HPR5_9STRA|nr:stress transcription factor A [Seminavis robusta]|eukprot:Sro1120_g243320.1 stress transcription factor A (310) ;mRNA; f:16114-17043